MPTVGVKPNPSVVELKLAFVLKDSLPGASRNYRAAKHRHR